MMLFWRPEETERHEAFLKVANYLEQNDDEQITVAELVKLMGDFLNYIEKTAYSLSNVV